MARLMAEHFVKTDPETLGSSGRWDGDGDDAAMAADFSRVEGMMLMDVNGIQWALSEAMTMTS